MPQIDLDPDRYRVKTRNGQWLSREKTWPLFYAAAVALGLCGFAWWYRAELTLVTLVSLVGGTCLALGIVIGSWLKRFD